MALKHAETVADNIALLSRWPHGGGCDLGRFDSVLDLKGTELFFVN